MLLSLGLIFLVGLAMSGICKKLKLPGIIGMLFSGIVLGPFVLDFLDPKILNISQELRQIALIIILLKAGLSLDIHDLKKVGRPAILMAFLPALLEILIYAAVAPLLFGISFVEALLMGTVLAAVSPAIIVPRMVNLIEINCGTKKSIPQMILAGASCDDVFVIVLFTGLLSVASGQGIDSVSIYSAPVSMILGVFIGFVFGVILSVFFEQFHKLKKHIRNSAKVVIILGISFVIVSAESMVNFPFSGLLAVVTMTCVFKLKSVESVTRRLSLKFGKLWIAAELILFVLVGATVEIDYLFKAGLPAFVVIFIGLIVRSLGVYLSLVKTNLNNKERGFCIFAYLPKATVQAAIGSIPLGLGLPSGEIILTVAVLAIIVTAPLGALLVDLNYKKMLED